MQQPILIDARNVVKTYHVGKMDVHALRGVNIRIRKGEVACIIGRSGSGKSTLLNVLAGLEKTTAGELVVLGQHMERMTESELIVFRQMHIGFVFQSFNLMPYYTALENVALPLIFRGVSQGKRMRLARQMLGNVGLGSHMRHKPSEMSGGQQQRVGIARALVTDPEIVFADEPTGNLDSATSDAVMRQITDMMHRENRTLVMVTHDPHMTEYADTVIEILDGQIVNVRSSGGIQHASAIS